MKTALLAAAFTLSAAPAIAASCTQQPFSDPKSIFGAIITCSDGSSYTYRDDALMGATIKNNQTFDTLYSNNMFREDKPLVETFTSRTTGSTFTLKRY